MATCDSLRDMSPRPPQDAATWHDALRAADARAHEAEAERVREHGIADLETRLARANAHRLALRDGVAHRDTLLRRFLAADALLARRALRRLARTVRRR